MPSSFDDLPEIARLGSGQGLIRLPFGQDVPFTDRVRAIVDTGAFQRLRQVSQLGLASAVYPGATHSRFEHALGVFHNALQYLNQLGRDPRFVAIVDRHTADVLLCAALLHDIGHWPMCHPIEDMELPELPTHEAFAERILSEDVDLSNALRTHWRVEPGEVLDVLDGENDTPALRLVRSILSGPIDIDKLDYLDRDSLHAGVPYGRNFDKNRLIASLVVNEAGDGLAITAKGKTAAELMVFARYVMFSEVYWHHAVRGATAMFARAFYELRGKLDLAKFLRGTEYDAVNELRRHASGTPWEPLAEGVFGSVRRLYKQVAEWGPLNAPALYRAIARRPYADLVRLAEHVAERLRAGGIDSISPPDLLIDAPPPGREVEFRVDIHYPKERIYRPLEAVSPVTEALARRQFDDAVKRVRVFVHPRLRPAIESLPDFDAIVAESVAETFDAVPGSSSYPGSSS
ncbi:MAG: HD domain-containing protein [Planctomycetaceae bacterium]